MQCRVRAALENLSGFGTFEVPSLRAYVRVCVLYLPIYILTCSHNLFICIAIDAILRAMENYPN